MTFTIDTMHQSDASFPDNHLSPLMRAPAEVTGDPVARVRWINEHLPAGSLYSDAKRAIHPESRASWRLSPEPFWITEEMGNFLTNLGSDLQAFYRAINTLYLASVKGSQPAWVAEYFDLGRPETLVDYSRLNRTRRAIPGVIRPDLFYTDTGFVATELDSVPGGIGFSASMGALYASLGDQVLGGEDGMINGFLGMVASAAGAPDPVTAIVVSDESGDYWDEMAWLAQACRDRGHKVFAVRPQDVSFSEDGLRVPAGVTPGPRDPEPTDQTLPTIQVSVVYRFFELYDIKNVPKWELMLYAAKKQKVVITPPIKSYLEEKLTFALMHHPALARYWSSEMTSPVFERVKAVIPETWILDPRPLPPHATIPGFEANGAPLQSWNQLMSLGQKDRRLVVKPSGFDATAWGSRGVKIGHDLPEGEWRDAVDGALAGFTSTRSILQRFQTVRRATVPWYDFETGTVKTMPGRARLTPYYFASGTDGGVTLGGVMATVVPIDKKLIHGMVDAVMVPCAIRRQESDTALTT